MDLASVHALLQDPVVGGLCLNVLASIGYDSAKATGKWAINLFRAKQPETDDWIEKQFETLNARDQVKRHAQHLLAEVVAISGADSIDPFACDLAIEKITAYLVSSGNDRVSIAKIVTASLASGDKPISEHDAARIAACALVALAASPLSGIVIHHSLEIIKTDTAELRISNERLESRTQASAHCMKDMQADIKLIASKLDLLVPPSHSPATDSEFELLGTAVPLLPADHVPRTKPVKQLGAKLRSTCVLAVGGYHACGKTTVLIEYALASKRRCIWITLPSIDNQPLQHARYVQRSVNEALKLPDGGDFGRNLQHAANSEVLLIVIDNAERLEDLAHIGSLLTAARGSYGRIQVLLSYADDPSFASNVVLRLAHRWPLPGMQANEAMELFEKMGVPNVARHKATIVAICSLCDGHVGLIRASRHLLENESGVGVTSLLQLHVEDPFVAIRNAVMSAFLNTVEDDQLKLCKRVSVCPGSFSRELARAVSAEASDEDFDRVWSVTGEVLFQRVEERRFQLPYLYRIGFQELLSPTEGVEAHKAIADALSVPQGTAIRVDDAVNCVFHAVAAGDANVATHYAMSFLVHAQRSGRTDVLSYLLKQYRFLLSDSTSVRRSRERTVELNWLNLQLLACKEIEDEVVGNAVAEQLILFLEEHRSSLTRKERHRSALHLLLHASIVGNVDVAWRAWDHLDQRRERVAPRHTETPHIAFIVQAYYTSKRPLSDFAMAVIQWVARNPTEAAAVWGDAFCWQMWRSLAMTMAAKHGSDACSQDSLREIADSAAAAGLPEVALVFEAAIILHLIDVARDLTHAALRATGWRLDEVAYPSLLLFLSSVKGDALRCNQQFELARDCYIQGELASIADGGTEYTNCCLGAAVCESRLGDNPAAIARLESLSTHRRLDGDNGLDALDDEAKVRLELAALQLHSHRLSDALDQLLVVYRAVKDSQLKEKYWVVLAQLAMGLTDIASGERTPEEVAVPGFTYGLSGDSLRESGMKGEAPAMVLEIACRQFGKHQEALRFYEQLEPAVKGTPLEWPHHFNALRSAEECKSLDQYALIARRLVLADTFADHATILAQSRDWVYWTLTKLAFAATKQPIDFAVWDRCLHQAKNSASADAEFINQVLNGIFRCAISNDSTLIESAFREAINRKLLDTARGLAFCWCYRAGIEMSVREVCKWHFRLAWLNAQTLKDADNARIAVENERQYWSCVNSSGDADFSEITDALSNSPDNDLDTAHKLEAATAIATARNLGLDAFYKEVKYCYECGHTAPWLGEVIKRNWLSQWTAFAFSSSEDFLKDHAGTLADTVNLLDLCSDPVDSPLRMTLAKLQRLITFSLGDSPAASDLLPILLESVDSLLLDAVHARLRWFELLKVTVHTLA